MEDFFDNLFSQIENEYKEKYQAQMDIMSFWTKCMCYINAQVEENE